MKKATSLIMSLLMLFMVSLMIFPAFARDTRYYSHWNEAKSDTSFWGNWQDFGNTAPHPPWQTIVYRNKFASEIDMTAGFQSSFCTIYLNADMQRTSLDGTKYVKLTVFAEPKSVVGAQILVEPRIPEYEVKVTCSALEGAFAEEFYISDFRKYKFGIKFKMNLGHGTNPKWFAWQAKFYKYEHISGNTWQEFPLTTITLEGYVGDMPDQTKFCHEVSAKYGIYSSSSGTWSAYFSIWDIGIRPDIATEDCYIGGLDYGTFAAGWGKSIAGVGLETWFATTYWKTDMDCDGVIGGLDYGYFGSYWGYWF